jgi:hypothetical protein
MLKKVALLCFGIAALNALQAQDLEKLSPTTRTKLENAIKRRGRFPESMIYQDSAKKIFHTQAGHMYAVYFYYDMNSQAKRQTIVYRLDENGKRLKALTPNMDKGLRDGTRQLFYIVIDRSAETTGPMKPYQVSTNSASMVVIYKIDKGL